MALRVGSYRAVGHVPNICGLCVCLSERSKDRFVFYDGLILAEEYEGSIPASFFVFPRQFWFVLVVIASGGFSFVSVRIQ